MLTSSLPDSEGSQLPKYSSFYWFNSRGLGHDQQRRPTVGKTRRHPLRQSDLAIGLTQQQRTAIGRYPARCETGFHAARKMRCKREDFLITLCHKKGRLSSAITTHGQRSYDTEKTAFRTFFFTPNHPNRHSGGEICGLAEVVETVLL
jgi:hypothetical protein